MSYTDKVLTVIACLLAIQTIQNSPFVENAYAQDVMPVAICRNLYSMDCGDVVGVRKQSNQLKAYLLLVKEKPPKLASSFKKGASQGTAITR